MTAKSYEGYYKLLQDASFHHDKALSEDSRRHQIKAHEVFTEPCLETHDHHPSPQDDTQPTVEEDTLVETYEVHMSNFKPRTTHPGYLSQKSSGRNSLLRIGSSSLSMTRSFLPRLGHHLQVILEPYQMLLGLQIVENQEESLATKDKKKKLMHQIILPGK